MGSGAILPEMRIIMVLTVPLLFLLVTLCSANIDTGGEYGVQEGLSPSDLFKDEPLQTLELPQPVSTGIFSIYSSDWSNNIPGLGKRTRVAVAKRAPVPGWESGWGWPKRSAMARQAHPCYKHPLS